MEWSANASLSNTSVPTRSLFTTVCSLTIVLTAVVGGLLNLLIIAAFARRRSLLTPFTAHVLHLCLSNLLLIFTATPLLARHSLLGRWDMGRVACRFYLYCVWTLYCLPILQHLFIAYDRLLAVCWPLLYRKANSLAAVTALSGLALAYAHLWALPLLLLDGRRRLAADEWQCFVDIYACPLHAITVQLMLYGLPILATYAAAPLVVAKVWHKRLRRMRMHSYALPEPTDDMVKYEPSEVCSFNPASLPGRHSRQSSLAPLPSYPSHCSQTPSHASKPPSSQTLTFLQFLRKDPKLYLFCLLVSAEMFFWGPKLTYYLLLNNPAYFHPDILLAVTANYGLLYCTDPLIYLFCLDGLRKEVISILRCRPRTTLI
ncbi:uncharacterized protein LOC129599758 [Paramacrobiotus metropolitanus]|uniref:uncharacterized protein LOC129599758 n=1 Tax=Paramacrobiotus metropolitanus TaxID=2943436 RepID=UPI002446215F|nr:uncharacterized protein LOC129599758 [Paramacrobiotus metropolitanus]